MMHLRWWTVGAAILLIIVGGLWYWHTAPDRELARYLSLEEQVRTITLQDGAPLAVTFLQEHINRDPSIANFCHPLAHEIGQTAVDEVGFEHALRFEFDICGSGYVHGVVEKHMKGIPDIVASLQSICPPESPRCFHGIGHGLMLRSENDLPNSLKHCHTFTQKWQRVQCAEGVFMENFEADFLGHSTDYLDPRDPYFPCRGQDVVDEGVCAFYVPRYFIETRGSDYDSLIAYCNDVPEGPRDACFKGVGDTAMKFRISDPLFAKSLCEKVPADKRHYCIQGMTSYFIVHFASAKKGNELCILLMEQDRPACVKIVKESMAAYPG